MLGGVTGDPASGNLLSRSPYAHWISQDSGAAAPPAALFSRSEPPLSAPISRGRNASVVTAPPLYTRVVMDLHTAASIGTGVGMRAYHASDLQYAGSGGASGLSSLSGRVLMTVQEQRGRLASRRTVDSSSTRGPCAFTLVSNHDPDRAFIGASRLLRAVDPLLSPTSYAGRGRPAGQGRSSSTSGRRELEDVLESLVAASAAAAGGRQAGRGGPSGSRSGSSRAGGSPRSSRSGSRFAARAGTGSSLGGANARAGDGAPSLSTPAPFALQRGVTEAAALLDGTHAFLPPLPDTHASRAPAQLALFATAAAATTLKPSPHDGAARSAAPAAQFTTPAAARRRLASFQAAPSSPAVSGASKVVGASQQLAPVAEADVSAPAAASHDDDSAAVAATGADASPAALVPASTGGPAATGMKRSPSGTSLIGMALSSLSLLRKASGPGSTGAAVVDVVAAAPQSSRAPSPRPGSAGTATAAVAVKQALQSSTGEETSRSSTSAAAAPPSPTLTGAAGAAAAASQPSQQDRASRLQRMKMASTRNIGTGGSGAQAASATAASEAAHAVLGGQLASAALEPTGPPIAGDAPAPSSPERNESDDAAPASSELSPPRAGAGTDSRGSGANTGRSPASEPATPAPVAATPSGPAVTRPSSRTREPSQPPHPDRQLVQLSLPRTVSDTLVPPVALASRESLKEKQSVVADAAKVARLKSEYSAGKLTAQDLQSDEILRLLLVVKPGTGVAQRLRSFLSAAQQDAARASAAKDAPVSVSAASSKRPMSQRWKGRADGGGEAAPAVGATPVPAVPSEGGAAPLADAVVDDAALQSQSRRESASEGEDASMSAPAAARDAQLEASAAPVRVPSPAETLNTDIGATSRADASSSPPLTTPAAPSGKRTPSPTTVGADESSARLSASGRDSPEAFSTTRGSFGDVTSTSYDAAAGSGAISMATLTLTASSAALLASGSVNGNGSLLGGESLTPQKGDLLGSSIVSLDGAAGRSTARSGSPSLSRMGSFLLPGRSRVDTSVSDAAPSTPLSKVASFVADRGQAQQQYPHQQQRGRGWGGVSAVLSLGFIRHVTEKGRTRGGRAAAAGNVGQGEPAPLLSAPSPLVLGRPSFLDGQDEAAARARRRHRVTEETPLEQLLRRLVKAAHAGLTVPLLHVGESGELLVPPSTLLLPSQQQASGSLPSNTGDSTRLYLDQLLRVHAAASTGGLPSVAHVLRSQAMHALPHSGTHPARSVASAATFAGGASVFAPHGPSARPAHLNALVLAAFSAVRMSKVVATRDWRTWDWGAVAVLLDHHLPHPGVLGEVLAKTNFMHRLGDFLCRWGGGGDTVTGTGMAALPWTPAALRFLRAARQWLLLCLHHPLGRELLRVRQPVTAAGNAASSAAAGKPGAGGSVTGASSDFASNRGLVGELVFAVWCTLARSLRRMARGNASFKGGAPGDAGRTAPGTPSGKSLLVAALSRAKGKPASQPDSGDTLVASSIRDVLGPGVSGEPLAVGLSRAPFALTLAREAVSLLGVLASCPAGLEVLASVRTAPLLALPDAPDHRGLLFSLRGPASAEHPSVSTGGIPPSLHQSADDVLATLIHLGDSAYAPGREYLARQLLPCLDYSSDGPARVLLWTWCTSYAAVTAQAAPEAGGSAASGAPPRTRRLTEQSIHSLPGSPALNAAPLRRFSFATRTMSFSLGDGAFSSSGVGPAGGAGSPSLGGFPGWGSADVFTATGPAVTVTKSLALYSTCFLRALLRRGSPGFASWAVELLVIQMYHADSELACAALSVLTEACERSRVYRLSALARQPPLSRFSLTRVHPLALSLAGEASGVSLLKSQGLLRPLLSHWLRVGHVRHTMQLEAALASSFSTAAVAVEVPSVGLQPDVRAAVTAGMLLPPLTQLARSTPAADDVVAAMCAASPSSAANALFIPASESLAAHALLCGKRPSSDAPSQPNTTTLFVDTPEVPSPWPLPLVVPPASRLPGSDDASEPAFAAKEAASGAWSAQLDALLRLPWRIEVSVEWVASSSAGSAASGAAPGPHAGISTGLPGPAGPVGGGIGRTFSADLEGVDLRIVGSVPGVASSGGSLPRGGAVGSIGSAAGAGTSSTSGGSAPLDAAFDEGSSEQHHPAPVSHAHSQAAHTHHRRTLMRSDLPVDAFVDLSVFSRECDGLGALSTGEDAGGAPVNRNSSAPLLPCDGFIRGVPIDPLGVHASFPLPPGAKLRAALFCGVHAVSELGEIPLTALPLTGSGGSGGDDATGGGGAAGLRRTGSSSSVLTTASGAQAAATAAEAAYPSAAGLLRQLADTTGWDEPPRRKEGGAGSGGSGSASAGLRSPEPLRPDRRDTTTGGGYRSRSSRGGRTTDGGDGDAGDDGDYYDFPEREGGSRHHRSTAGAASEIRRHLSSGSVDPDAPRGSDEGADLEALGMVMQRDEHDAIDDAPTRLRRRNAAALGSLSVPCPRRHACAWALDAGVVEIDSAFPGAALPGGAGSAATTSIDLVHSVTGGPTGDRLWASTSLPDTLAGGPEATTGVVSGTILGTVHPKDATEAQMRAAAERFAAWHMCDSASAASVQPEAALRAGKTPASAAGATNTGGACSPRASSISAASLADAAGTASGDERVHHVSPGSPVRWTFRIHKSSGSVHLEAIDFGFLLLPRSAAGEPLPATLYDALSSTRAGVRILERAGHLDALMQVAFPPGRDDPIVAVGAADAPSPGVALQRRAAMTALAQVAASPHGYAAVQRAAPDFTVRVDAAARGLVLHRLDDEGTGQCHMSARAEPFDDVSMRQTATHVLGLVSRHPRGFADVTLLGWVASQPHSRAPSGMAGTAIGPLVVLPQMVPTAYALVEMPAEPGMPAGAGVSADDLVSPSAFLHEGSLPQVKPDWAPVLARVHELASRISQREARSYLLRRKSEAPELFASPGLYAHVHGLLSRYTLSLPLRRFLHALFDRVSFSDKAWDGSAAW